mgnify:CR=1 FL=1
MDSFEINKIIAAILVTVLLVFGIGKISDIVFHVEKPNVQGYKVEVKVVGSSTTQTNLENQVDISALLALGNVEDGKKVFKVPGESIFIPLGSQHRAWNETEKDFPADASKMQEILLTAYCNAALDARSFHLDQRQRTYVRNERNRDTQGDVFFCSILCESTASTATLIGGSKRFLLPPRDTAPAGWRGKGGVAVLGQGGVKKGCGSLGGI